MLTKNYLNRLYEASLTQLKHLAKPETRRKVRAEGLKIQYKGISKKGVITFMCTSGTIPGKYYIISIILKDIQEASNLVIDGKPISNKDAMKLAIAGDISIHCTCPDFKYRYAYLAYTKGFGIITETRFPKIRNRNLKGSSCKHIQAVLNALPMYFTSMQSDYVKIGYLAKPKSRKKK